MASLASQVSVDAAPSTPTGIPFSSRVAMLPSSGPSDQRFREPSLIDIDAVAGPEDASRRNTASLIQLAEEQEARQVAADQVARQWRAPPPVAREQQRLDTIHYGQPLSKESGHIPLDRSHLKELEIKFKNSDLLGSYDDSTYGSMSSIEICSSTQSDDWLDELRKYEKEMPPEIRMGYLDVLILYHEDDRTQAEAFRQHLMSEIEVENGPIKTMLYDDPEMVAICGSLIGHLDQAVQRSTYVFIYMTKTLVSDKWCEFQSESCLMEAITNPLKMWCVVPVYTEKRNKTFRVPMGLNTLKGVNYYNNDKFYRKGVSRLIGDKISVRIQADEDHRTKQKVWLEGHKRKQLVQREQKRRDVAYQEEQTRKAKEWIQHETERLIQMGVLPPTMQHSASDYDIPRNPPVLHHSQSVNSLKPVHPQNPAVSEYFQDMLHQQKTQGYTIASYTSEELLNIQRVFPGTPQFKPAAHGQHGQAIFPPVENSANYMHNHHSVNRTISRPVGDMKLSSNSQIRDEFSDIPVELLKQIQHMSPSEQEHHKQEYLKQLQDHCISKHQQQQQQNRMLAQQDQNNLASVQQDMQNSVVSQHDNPHRSGVQHTMPAFDQLNSASSVGSGNLRNDSLLNSALVSNMDGSTSPLSYQSSDRSRQARVVSSQNLSPGNLPNNSLLNCSHETDGGPSSPALRGSSIPMSRAPEKQENVRKLPSSDSDSEKDNKMSVGRKKKEKKVVKHVTINVYQAGNVQIGDHNLANQKEIVTMSNSSDDDGDDSVLTPGDVSPKEKTTVNTRSSQMMKKVDVPSGARSHAELGPQTVAGPCTVDAAPSTVADVRNMSFKPDVQPEHGTKNGETQHGTDIKGMTLPKRQVDITAEEAEEVQEEEPNSGGEKCSNSSKVDVFQQSSKSVENSQKFEGSVNINSSESEKSTAKSLQKDIEVFSVRAKPIARTKPQVAHIAPIVHDPVNDNVDVTCVKTVVDSEYTERKVPVASNWLDDDRSQTFVKGVAPQRQVAPNSSAESMQREDDMPSKLQTKSNGSLDKCCQDDLKSTAVPAASFSVGRSTNAHQLFYQRFNQLPSSSVDPVEGEHIGQREAALDDSIEQGEIIEAGDAKDFEFISRDEHPLNQASSSMEESGKLVESRRWQPKGSKKNDKECHIS